MGKVDKKIDDITNVTEADQFENPSKKGVDISSSKDSSFNHKTSQDGMEGASVFWIVLSLILVMLIGFTAFLLSKKMKKKIFTAGCSSNGFPPWSKNRPLLERRPTVMISHSLPDLSRSVSEEQLLNSDVLSKKVLRQTTMPAVSERHESFRRQLSSSITRDRVRFSVCSLKRKDKLGSIEPELYRGALERQESIESSGSDVESAGRLSFALKYDTELTSLFIKVIQAENLPVKDVSGSSDPYVKVYLLPDKVKKYCTKVHRRNLSPVFNETFLFSVGWEELSERNVQFSIYDFDRFSRNDLIGQVVLHRLHDLVQPDVELQYVMDIKTPKQKDTKDLGDVMLSLCYLPKAGRLTVTIIKMRNLRALDITGSSDPYVKVLMLYHGRRIKKKKTTIKRSTLNPLYNESLVFDVPNENIQDITLLIKVMDYDRVSANDLIGVVVIGKEAIGQGREHWIEMMDSSRRPVAQWYTLQDSVPPSIPVSPLKPVINQLTCLSAD